jgi:hypothetical protein
MPGVLGLDARGLTWHGIFADTVSIPSDRIQKIATGHVLSSGRRLLRMEALRFDRIGDDPAEFVVTHPAAEAWRSHLGLWAAAQRQADAERVTPGR